MFDEPTASSLSKVLLGLYDAARGPAVEQFQDKALDLLREVVDFDASIWGVGTIAGDTTHIQDAHVVGFPVDAIDILNRGDAHNIVGKAVREIPGVAHTFTSQAVFSDPLARALWQDMGGINQVLCIGSLERKASLLSFFAIARRSNRQPFSGDDAKWIETLAPHMEATLQICRVAELSYKGSSEALSHRRTAICGATGALNVAEPGFVAMLLEGWPNWQGPHLPRELAEAVALPGRQEQLKGDIRAVVSGPQGQRTIVLAHVLPLDLLTAMEAKVAQAFAGGRTYKEVALMLDRSPATVRHHLRSVYLKLDVQDKGALAHRILGGLV